MLKLYQKNRPKNMNLSKKKHLHTNISIIRFEKANIFEALSAFMQGTEIFFFYK